MQSARSKADPCTRNIITSNRLCVTSIPNPHHLREAKWCKTKERGFAERRQSSSRRCRWRCVQPHLRHLLFDAPDEFWVRRRPDLLGWLPRTLLAALVQAAAADLLVLDEGQVAGVALPTEARARGPQGALGEREGFLDVARIAVGVLLELRSVAVVRWSWMSLRVR